MRSCALSLPLVQVKADEKTRAFLDEYEKLMLRTDVRCCPPRFTALAYRLTARVLR